MDIQPFKIIFPTTLKKSDWIDLDGVSPVDCDNWVYAELLFRETYYNLDNRWAIQLGEVSLEFFIADIAYIWDELADVLAASMNPSMHKWDVMFHFAKQGTNIALIVTERDETSIFVTIEKAYSDEKYLPIPISKQNWVDEWRGLAEYLVQQFVEHGFIAADDPAIAEYFGRMPPKSP